MKEEYILALFLTSLLFSKCKLPDSMRGPSGWWKVVSGKRRLG